MPDDPTHLDKLGTPLEKGDVVRLVYGGDQHTARVTRLTRQLDADHIEIELTSTATVPAGSVARLRTAKQQAALEAPKTEKPDDKPEEKKTTTTTHKPTTHRSTTRKGQ